MPPADADDPEVEAVLRQLSAATRRAAGREAAARAGVVERAVPLLLHHAQRVVAAPEAADQAAPVPAALPPLLRSLRNLCTGGRETQELLWQREAPGAAVALALRLLAPLDGGVPAWLIGSSAEAVECACLAVQLIGNSAAAHETTSTSAWRLLFPAGFSALLRPPLPAGLRKPPLPSLVSCVAMVMQTCLAKSTQQAALRQELAETAAGAALTVRLMEHMVAANADDLTADDDAPQAEEKKWEKEEKEQVDGQAYEWIGMLIAGQCAAGHAETTFDALGAVREAPGSGAGLVAAQPEPETTGVAPAGWAALANHPQLRWLEVISAALAADAATITAKPTVAQQRTAASVAEFLLNRVLPGSLLDTPEAAAGLFAPDTPISALEAVYVAVHTIGLLLAAYSSDSPSDSGGRVLSNESMCALGARASVLLGVSGPPPIPPASTTEDSEIGKLLPRGFKSQLLKLIGNVSFKNRRAQDAIHSNGGTALVCNHTMVDTHNPYSREWGVLALRNLCEENEKIQGFLADMQAQGAVSTRRNPHHNTIPSDASVRMLAVAGPDGVRRRGAAEDGDGGEDGGWEAEGCEEAAASCLNVEIYEIHVHNYSCSFVATHLLRCACCSRHRR